MNRYFRNVLLTLLLLTTLTGCAHTVPLRGDMIHSEINSSVTPYRSAKKIILIIPNDIASQVSEKAPASFAGGAATWSIPIGKMLSETCYEYFTKLCGEPVKVLPELPQFIQADYDYIVIEPRIINFEWELNQARNLGFAITPRARIELQLIEHSNKDKIIEGIYDSGFIDGETYAMATIGGVRNRVSKVIFRAIFAGLEQAATRIPKENLILEMKEKGQDSKSDYQSLIELKGLYDKDIISKEEYEQKRKKYIEPY